MLMLFEHVWSGCFCLCEATTNWMDMQCYHTGNIPTIATDMEFHFIGPACKRSFQGSSLLPELMEFA